MPSVLDLERATGRDAVVTWSAVLREALRWRRNHWNGDSTWDRAIRLARGDHWANNNDTLGGTEPQSDSPRTRITVNVVGSIIQDFLPFLVRRDPGYLIKPRSPKYVDSARLQTDLLNYVWSEHNMTKPMKRAVLDMLVIGHGIAKTGWSVELDWEAVNRAGGRINYRDSLRKEAPWVRRVNPKQFLFDPEAPDHDLESARWAAELVTKPLQDVLNTKRYSQSVIGKIKRGELTPMTLQTFIGSTGVDAPFSINDGIDQSTSEAMALVPLWEVWDKKFEKRWVFIEGIEEPLVEQDWPFKYLDGFPYTMLRFVDIPNEIYPLGIPALLEDQQLELNRLRTKMFNHHRRFNRFYEADVNHVDPTELMKLQEGDDGDVILTHGAPGEQVVHPIQDAAISIDTDRVEAAIKNDLRELSGFDALARGGRLPGRTSATEIQARQGNQGLKIEERAMAVDKFFSNVGRQILQHMKANMSRAIMVPVFGSQVKATILESDFRELTPSDIQGEFDVTVATVSAERVDPVMDRQQRIQIVQLLLVNLPLLVQSGVQIHMGELFRWLLESFDIKDLERFFPLAGVALPPLNPDGGYTSPAQGQQAAPLAAVNPTQSAVQAGAAAPGNDALGALLGGAL